MTRTQTEQKKDKETTATGDQPMHPHHTVVERMEEVRDNVSAKMHKWPVATAAAVGGIGLAAATLIGAGEIAIAGAAGYAAYRWLRGERTGRQAA